MFLSITEFIAHFHPLLVHLPIGILLAALFLQWFSQANKYKALQQAVPFLLFCGTITAVISCITGFLLSVSDDYDKTLVSWHMWMGIGVALASFVLYLKERRLPFTIGKKILSVGILLLLMITGHLGGSLTHGSDYLMSPLTDIFGTDSFSKTIIRPIPDVQEALAYNDIIKPIFQNKCYSCHGSSKQKGKLRMDDAGMLMKGGKEGKIIAPGMADSSELIKRLLLPVDHDHHMPPKEKSQLSESQIALVHWWINNHADFEKKVKSLEQPDKIKPVLLGLQKIPEVKNILTGIPDEGVEKGDDEVIGRLREKGVVVLPVVQNSNYLLANFVANSVIKQEDLELLLSLKDQLVWLKLGYANLSDSNMAIIAQLKNITRLGLEHTAITDAGVGKLKALQKLEYLNVAGARITGKGILQLKEMKSLHSLFLFQTAIDRADWTSLQKAFPKTQLDSGGYSVPFLANDTVIIKAKK